MTCYHPKVQKSFEITQIYPDNSKVLVSMTPSGFRLLENNRIIQTDLKSIQIIGIFIIATSRLIWFDPLFCFLATAIPIDRLCQHCHFVQAVETSEVADFMN